LEPIVTEPSWDLFTRFFAVTSTGSVNGAARELNMSQPDMATLDKDASLRPVPLFERLAMSGGSFDRWENKRFGSEGV